MKTNEELKKVLAEQITQELEELFEHLEPIKEGEFQQVEALILQSAMSIGRRWLEKLLNASREAIHARARREGVCGHRQRLVGIREKTVLTVMGKITIRCPYYQCMKEKNEEKEQETATGHHGSAPFDTLWGVEQGRTSPGVQKNCELFCSIADPFRDCRGSRNGFSFFPLGTINPSFDSAGGRNLEKGRRGGRKDETRIRSKAESGNTRGKASREGTKTMVCGAGWSYGTYSA